MGAKQSRQNPGLWLIAPALRMGPRRTYGGPYHMEEEGDDGCGREALSSVQLPGPAAIFKDDPGRAAEDCGHGRDLQHEAKMLSEKILQMPCCGRDHAANGRYQGCANRAG